MWRIVINESKKELYISCHILIYNSVHLLLIEVSKGDSAGHEDGGCLRHSEHLPAQALKEGGKLSLAGRLAPAGASCQDQLGEGTALQKLNRQTTAL